MSALASVSGGTIAASAFPTFNGDPSSLKFGTSGLRGLVTDLVGLPSRAYCAAFIRYLQQRNPSISRVLVGRDLRSSSPAIAIDCMAAIQFCGLEPVDCGALPTPALALEGQRLGCAAIMVTGSHIPDDRNGLKFYLVEGEISKTDEIGILAQYAALDVQTLASLATKVAGAVVCEPGASLRYMERYLAFFGADCLIGCRIAVYQHSSVARDILVDLLVHMGADVVEIGRAERFIPVDTEALEPELVSYIRYVAGTGAFDAIVSTDGDADRPLVADETGGILRGDVLGLLAAKLLGMRTIVTPVTSGSVIERSGLADRVIRTKVGSPYVLAAMEEAAVTGANDIIGFEANGGTLLASDAINARTHPLKALPTRDAVLPILGALIAVVRCGRPLSAVVEEMAVGHALADRLKDVPSELSRAFLTSLTDNQSFASRYFQAVGVVAKTDTLDGVRVELADSAVVHYRASGNAPELRCYVEAEDAAHAAELLTWGLHAARLELVREGHVST